MENKVKETREYIGMSARELARRTKSGAMTISDIENNKSIPSVLLALKISKALGTTVEELFFIKDEGE